MQGEPRVPHQPPLGRGALVRGVVVQRQMDGQVRGNCGVQLLQKLLELLGAAVPTEAPYPFPRVVVEGGKQPRRLVSGLVVAPPFRGAGEQWGDRLHPGQGLDVHLLIRAEDHRALGGDPDRARPRHGLCPRRTGPWTA